MSCTSKHFQGVFPEKCKIPLSHRAVQLAGLTETAAPDTSSLDFQNHPVLCHLDKGNHGLFRIIGVGEITFQLLQYRGGSLRIQGIASMVPSSL